MAIESSQTCVTFPAGSDLSSAQYKLVTLNSSGQLALTAAITDKPIGILQNKPSAQGAAGTVCVFGISKFISQGATDEGEILGAGTTDGALDQVASTVYPVGVCVKAAGDGETGSVMVNIGYTPTA